MRDIVLGLVNSSNIDTLVDRFITELNKKENEFIKNFLSSLKLVDLHKLQANNTKPQLKKNIEINNIEDFFKDIIDVPAHEIIISKSCEEVQEMPKLSGKNIHHSVVVNIQEGVAANLILNITKNIYNINITLNLQRASSLNLTINQYDVPWGVLNIQTHQQEYSSLNIHTYTHENSNVLNFINSNLEKNNSTINFFGIADGRKESFIGNKLNITHRASHTRSFQFYRNIAHDNSNVLFDGAIKVIKGAKKTEAYQTNDSILTSTSSVLHTRPTLSIFEDDVKCSHGATIGKIDKNQILYLCSRGIEKKTAEKLVLDTFLNKVFQKNNSKTIDYLLKAKPNSIIRSINSTGL